jgi:hypothetical protein
MTPSVPDRQESGGITRELYSVSDYDPTSRRKRKRSFKKIAYD